MTKSAQKKAVQYTRMCKFWRSNECKMGADCTFAHATTELRPSPKPCFEFTRTGFCTRGAGCRFVHEDGARINQTTRAQAALGSSGLSVRGFAGAACSWPLSSFAQFGFGLEPLREGGSHSQASLGPAFSALPGTCHFHQEAIAHAADAESLYSGLSKESQHFGRGFGTVSVKGPASCATDDAAMATQGLTSSMCLSTAPSTFSEDRPTSFWL